jgi:hypothetical protein
MVGRYLAMTVYHKDIGMIMVDAIEHDPHTNIIRITGDETEREYKFSLMYQWDSIFLI